MKLSSSDVKKLIAYAKTFVKTPYKRGAKEKNTLIFDCSSFVQHIFKYIGIELPRSSILQAADPQGVLLLPTQHKPIVYKPGDVLFMPSDRGYYFDEIFAEKHISIGHVVLYIGNGNIINARKLAGGVVIESLQELQKNSIYKTVAVKRYTTQRPIYAVPARSQYRVVRDKFWKHHSCGIVSLGTILEFYKKKIGTYEQLLAKGIKMNIRKEGVGWIHAGLVLLAKQYSLHGHAYDWNKDPLPEAFLKLTSLLEYGPIITSVYKHFNPKNDGHLIVVTGYKDGYIYYNEPASLNIKKIKQKIKSEYFLAGWKKRAIRIYP